MSEFPDLHRAYAKPTESETEEAWRKVRPKVGRAGSYWVRLLMAAAVLAGLVTAFGVGYATGRRAVPSAAVSPDSRSAGPAGVVIRPPELVAEPGR